MSYIYNLLNTPLSSSALHSIYTSDMDVTDVTAEPGWLNYFPNHFKDCVLRSFG